MTSMTSNIFSFAELSAKAQRDYSEARWYAAYSRSRHEKSVLEHLVKRNVESFLPVYEAVRRWRNGDHVVKLPLFPSYTFVRIALRDRLHVLKVPGVVRLVCIQGTPCPIDDAEVESLRRVVFAGVGTMPHPYLAAGRRVRITAGPLIGLDGILVRRKGAFRVVLSVDLIQRSIITEVPSRWLEPLLSPCCSNGHGDKPAASPLANAQPVLLSQTDILQ